MNKYVLTAGLMVFAFWAPASTPSKANTLSPANPVAQGASSLVEPAARSGRGVAVRRSAVVGRHGMARRTTVVRRGGAVAGRGAVVRRGGTAVRRTTVVRTGNWARPGRYWWRPGAAVAAGAAIGFVGASTAVAWAGSAPGPNMCWYYTNSARNQGFWDLCP